MNKDSAFAYQAVYRYLAGLIDSNRIDGELKLPSLRQLALRLKVSVSTTKYAYALLEDEGRVYSRPRRVFQRSGAVAGLPAPELHRGLEQGHRCSSENARPDD